MFFPIIAFLGGDVFLQSFQTLPSLHCFYVGLILVFLLLVMHKYSKYFLVISFFGLGFCYSGLYAHHILSWTLPKRIENKEVLIVGEIASIPAIHDDVTQFNFKTKDGLIRVNWKSARKRLVVGDEWKLALYLKRIHSTQNHGAMDFEAIALQKKIRAKGMVNLNGNNQLLKHRWYDFPLNHLRQHLMLKIENILPHSESSKWLVGLIMGERNNISQSAWQVLRNTGTNHLMVIAGLHIGIVAGFIHWLCLRGRRLFAGFFLKIPLQIFSKITAFIVVLYYSAQAGFSIPTQRAILMLSLFVWVSNKRKQVNPWHVWSFALFLVLLINPLNTLSDSFWLSFFTIALIIYGMNGRIQPAGFWWEWGRVQWVIALGLIPLGIYFFQECSFISVLANSIAIPWLGFLILPFCFLSGVTLLFSTYIGKFFLNIASGSLDLLWSFLSWFSSFKVANIHLAIPSIGILCVAAIGMILFLLPYRVAGRWFGCFLILPLIFQKQIAPEKGDYWLTMLDVGQGLSLVVRTLHHNLLFDTGAKYGESMDAGAQIIVPYLLSKNIHHLDTVIVSHGDNDHRGGLPAVMQSIAVDEIITSVPNELPYKHIKRCIAGTSWLWDGVKFLMLHPTQSTAGYGNDSCCVLLIDNGSRKVLLTADIESWAEKKILENYQDKLAADILVAPHHGSKTSSSLEFVRAIHPQYVLFPVGYLNRYHFPHQQTLETYTDLHIRQIDSVTYGEIEFKLSSKLPVIASSYRKINKHYWFD